MIRIAGTPLEPWRTLFVWAVVLTCVYGAMYGTIAHNEWHLKDPRSVTNAWGNAVLIHLSVLTFAVGIILATILCIMVIAGVFALYENTIDDYHSGKPFYQTTFCKFWASIIAAAVIACAYTYAVASIPTHWWPTGMDAAPLKIKVGIVTFTLAFATGCIYAVGFTIVMFVRDLIATIAMQNAFTKVKKD